MDTTANSRAADELRGYRDRFADILIDKADLAERERELKSEVKGRGYTVKAIVTLARRKVESSDERDARRAYEAQLELYAATLGQSEAPLSDDARAKMSPPPAQGRQSPDDDHRSADADAPLAPPSAPLGPTEADIAAAADEGARAFSVGEKVTANPYPAGDPRRRAWDEGFCMASGSDGMDIPAHLRRPEKAKKAEPPKSADDDETGRDDDAGDTEDGE